MEAALAHISNTKLAKGTKPSITVKAAPISTMPIENLDESLIFDLPPLVNIVPDHFA